MISLEYWVFVTSFFMFCPAWYSPTSNHILWQLLLFGSIHFKLIRRTSLSVGQSFQPSKVKLFMSKVLFVNYTGSDCATETLTLFISGLKFCNTKSDWIANTNNFKNSPAVGTGTEISPDIPTTLDPSSAIHWRLIPIIWVTYLCWRSSFWPESWHWLTLSREEDGRQVLHRSSHKARIKTEFAKSQLEESSKLIMDFSICLGCTQLKLNPLRGEFWGPRRQLSMEKQIRLTVV